MTQDKAQELLNDIKGEDSACCGAPLYRDICSDCKEHSGSVEAEVSWQDRPELDKDGLPSE